MQIGRLDRRITIERAGESRDAYGELIRTYATLAEVWANVTSGGASSSGGHEELTGSELRRALERREFKVRYSATVAAVGPEDRVIYDGRTYDVRAVRELGRREGLVIYGEARAE